MTRIILLICLTAVPQIFPQQKELTVEDIFTRREFRAKTLYGLKWFDDGKKFSYLAYDQQSNSICIYGEDAETGKGEIILKENELFADTAQRKNFSMDNYSWSPGEKYILFTETLPSRGTKTGGNFYVYDMNKKEFMLSVESKELQENIKFSPDGKKIGFVRNNNLYFIDLETKKETQLTFDGSGVLLNGVFDWVYEEEFSVIEGWEWAPDSRNIAFWRLDQSAVPEFNIMNWDSIYPKITAMRYPKAGFPNSSVKIGAVNLESDKITWMDIGNEPDIYIPRIKFTANPAILSIQRLNRLQNKLDLLFADIGTGTSKLILTETDSAWVEVYDDLYFLKDQKRFIWSSDRDNFHHLYLYDYEGKMINQITKGNWEVTSLDAVNENSRQVYYVSNERGILYKDLFCIHLDGYGKSRLTSAKGEHKTDFSNNAQYFIDYYSNPSKLKSTSLYNSEGELIKILRDSDMSFLEEYNFSAPEFLSFKTSDGIELNAEIIKPADFDKSKKYPVLIYTYGGPGSQSVDYSWDGDFLWYELLNQKGYIIFKLDNRGTGGRGKKFKTIVYKNLGKWEVNDLIEGARYLSSLSFVDSSRIGIWGWSYGGYLAALSILKGTEYFKTAVAVSPVTHWKFYDTIYTERFMQTPALNPEGYEDSSPLNYAERLKGNFLLIHGTGDDNVHFQNSVELVNKLIDENKQFRTMFYPGRDHSISGGNATIQLFELMTEYILENL